MKTDGRNESAAVISISDTEGNFQESAPHPKQRLIVELKSCDISPGDVIRMKAK